jgi:uncharacterized membrane protein HdeD (DUF308 family)
MEEDMATRPIDVLTYDLEQGRRTVEYIHEHRAWFTALGVALIVLGLVAAGSSATATFVSMLFLSVVLLVGGIIRLVGAFSAREWTGSLLLALSGALYVVAGVLTYKHPIAAALALTLLFAALFLGVGLFRVITSIWYRFPNWGWVAVSGAISFALGLMLWNAWPVSGIWFIGLCIGIDLIVEGVGWLMLSHGADTTHSQQAPRVVGR